MTDTVYLVRLREAFNRADYDDTSATFNTEAKIRIFGDRNAAQDFATRYAPIHNPFNTQAVDDGINPGMLAVYDTCDETHWEYYVGADGSIGDESEPPEDDDSDDTAAVRNLSESVLIAAIETAGLPISPTNRTVSDWQIWWDANAPAMTDAQRAAVWFALVPNPYLILKLELEGAN